jgi:Holliday junction DNA helicase RuvA
MSLFSSQKNRTKIEEIFEEYCIVGVNGVGYIVYCSGSFLRSLDKAQQVSIFIHTILKDGMPYLYGFSEIYEQEIFILLISVQGVGAKMAIHVMDDISSDQLIEAIQQEDVKAFKHIPGVGPKIANRIINELKSNKKFLSTILNSKISTSNSYQIKQDAISALVNLGFKRTDVTSAVDEILRDSIEEVTIENIIRFAIAKLAK